MCLSLPFIGSRVKNTDTAVKSCNQTVYNSAFKLKIVIIRSGVLRAPQSSSKPAGLGAKPTLNAAKQRIDCGSLRLSQEALNSKSFRPPGLPEQFRPVQDRWVRTTELLLSPSAPLTSVLNSDWTSSDLF